MESVFDKFDVKQEQLSVESDKVSPEELKAGNGLEIVIGACSRFEGDKSISDRPMEVWLGWTRNREKQWNLPRSLRSHSDLSGRLRTQLAGHGLGYVDVGTGELLLSPREVGQFTFFQRKSGAPALLIARVKLRTDAGKLGGTGRGFVYHVESWAVTQEEAVSKLPELPAGEAKLLTVDATIVEDEAEEAKGANGKRPAGKRR